MVMASLIRAVSVHEPAKRLLQTAEVIMTDQAVILLLLLLGQCRRSERGYDDLK